MKELGLIMNLKKLGVTEDMMDGLVKATLIMEGGYKVLSQEDVLKILKKSM